MTYAERARHWNEWYDGLPELWRFQVVLWPLLLVGTVNMMLTVAFGFPFGLLVILAIFCLAAVRVPHKAGWVAPSGGDRPAQTVNLGRVDWAWDLNQRYDAMPEWRRFWVIPVVLIVVGAINMGLTLGNGFPFGLLFLLALLAIVAIRVPYVWGWLTPPAGPRAAAPAASSLMVKHDTTPAMPAMAPIAATAREPTTIEHEAGEPEAAQNGMPKPAEPPPF